tara:strand:+ start:2056 stop:2529 length:474 start_codon:yes stop_codon:yes gene_type:complete
MDSNYLNIYNNLIKFSRNKSIIQSFTDKDTFSDRLIIFLFHFGFFLQVYKNDENKEKMQKIYDFVFRQLELSIREIGYGDASINKKMKTYVNTFHSILEKINNWENLDIDTKNKILNSFFNITEEMSILRNYLDKYRLFLLKSSLNSFTKGVINLKF